MRLTRVRIILATVTALALMVGVGGAIAAGGSGGLKQEAARIADRTAMETAVAQNLGTTAAKLRAAIKASALAKVDAALAANEVTADEATTLKDAIADGSLPTMHLATAAGVAKELGTTEAKLNAAWSDAAKAQAKAHLAQAVTDGKLTQAQADQMTAKIDAATITFGSGPGGPGSPGGPGGHDGHDGPGGPGFGPPPGGSSSSSGSASIVPSSLKAA
jgi:hypothetical protein